jgi:hypothetical protein
MRSQDIGESGSAGNTGGVDEPAAAGSWQRLGDVARRLVRRLIEADRGEPKRQVNDA